MSLRLSRISKSYGAVVAVDDVSLDVARGTFVTLLGPSGSGKTTLLMTVAGFVEPSAGQVSLDQRDITALAPNKRNFGMVFQGYALFPHMTVAQNVMFPLRVRRMARAEAEERVRQVLDMVQLGSFAERKPAQLSGGQQQRVALARALVFDPELLLLDEPLGALDRKLRGELQEELKSLHRRIGRTFIAVTHDQEEALSMSDRIAVMRSGRLVQDGEPASLYDRPRTRFVADFLGKSNFFRGSVRERRPGCFFYTVGNERLLQAELPGWRPSLGTPVLLSLRPEKVELLAEAEGDNVVGGVVLSVGYLGNAFDLLARTAVGDIRASVPSWRAPFVPEVGMEISLGWAANAATPIEED